MSGEKRDFSQYDKMSTEELKEALRRCAAQTDGDADAELYIAELVAEREKREHPERYPNVGDEWERFKALYMPLADETDEERELPEVSAKPQKSRRRMSIGRRIAVGLAAALLLCAALVGTALAVNGALATTNASIGRLRTGRSPPRPYSTRFSSRTARLSKSGRSARMSCGTAA